MDPLPLLLVLLSAVSHGLWNFLAKSGKDKESNMFLLNLTSLLLFIPVFYMILPEIYFPLSILPYLIVSGLSETLYFLGLGKAYEEGDLSLVYPVARSSPVFVTLAAFLFLGEKITVAGLVGILVIFSGVYILHLKGLTRQNLMEPLRYLNTRSSRYALLAALGTTIYSISDKLGVTTVDPLLYSFWLGFFVTGMVTIVTVYRRGIGMIFDEAMGGIVIISFSGILMKGGYMLVLYAMSLAQVGYILAIRQISVVLGVLLGVLLLGEKYGKVRIIGSVIIFIGVYILGTLA
jgi:phosphonate utilization associated putative membrane protein